MATTASPRSSPRSWRSIAAIASIWSPSTISPRSSTAITRSASPSNASPASARAASTASWSSVGMRRAAAVVDVEPLGDAWSTRPSAPSARSTQWARRGTRRRSPQSTTTCRPASWRPCERSTRWPRSRRARRGARTRPRRRALGPRLGLAVRQRRAAPAPPRARAASGILRPPAAKSLMPLSAKGLWLAEITAAGAPRSRATCATPGVGSTPTSRTSAPSAQRPATSAASSIGPDRACRGRRRTAGRCRAPAPRRDRAR